MADGNIGGGMLPKLQNCIDAVENGVSRVHILDGRMAHCLLLEIFTNKGIGTAILGEGEEEVLRRKIKRRCMKEAEESVLHTYNRFRWYLIMGRACTLMTRTEKNIWILQRESPCRHLGIITGSTARR